MNQTTGRTGPESARRMADLLTQETLIRSNLRLWVEQPLRFTGIGMPVEDVLRYGITGEHAAAFAAAAVDRTGNSAIRGRLGDPADRAAGTLLLMIVRLGHAFGDLSVGEAVRWAIVWRATHDGMDIAGDLAAWVPLGPVTDEIVDALMAGVSAAEFAAGARPDSGEVAVLAALRGVTHRP